MSTVNILSVFAGLLVLAIGAYFYWFRSPLSKLKAEIEDLNRYLTEMQSKAEAAGDARQFYVEHFEDISNEFAKYESLRPVWIDFKKSLTRHKTAESEEIFSASDAAEYFSFHNFTRGLSMLFWNGYGGVFTGLGILGTFAGLTFGLYNIDMSSADVEVLKGGIASLLSGVQSAFITSLVGIFAAIVYNPLHNGVVNGFKKDVRRLALLVEEMFPRRTAEDWLRRNYVESEEQTRALKNIGTDVAEAICDGFEERFDDGVSRLCDQIEERIAPFFEGIETAINNLNAGFGDAIGRAMSEQAGKQMQRFAQALDDFAVSLKQTMDSSQRLSVEMNSSILLTLEELHRTLKAVAEESAAHQREAMKENADVVNRLLESMSTFAEQQEKTLTQSAEDNAEQMRLATALFQQSLSEHMRQTLDNSQRLTDDMNQKILATLEEMRRTLKDGAEDNAEQMKLATTLFQQSLSEHLRQTLDNSQRFTDDMNQKMLSTLEEMRQTLKDGAENNAEQMKLAAELFKATVEKYHGTLTQTCDKITNLLKGAEDFLLYVDDSTSAIKDAAEPVQQSTLALKNLLDQTEQATKKFHEEISAQLSTLTEANQRSEKNIFLLVAGLQEYEKNIEQAWKNYEGNFNRVGGELEKATNIITERLQKYNEMMNGGMQKALTDFDKSVSGAVGSLQALLEDLQDSIDELQKKRQRD